MTVRITKPEFNLREKITELDKPTGLKGNELMRSDTTQDARSFISAGRRNLLINGQFDVWQRATDSGSTTTSGYVSSDRWKSNASGGTYQITRQTFTPSQTEVPDNPRYYLRFAVTTGNNNISLGQRVEGVENVQGEVTLSFWAKGTNPANGYFDILNRQDFGSGGSVSSVVDTGHGNFRVTPNWQKFTFTFTPPSISGKTLGTTHTGFYECQIFRQPAGDNGTSAFTIDIANVQFERGRNATEFEKRPIGEELQSCMRYFYKWSSSVAYSNFDIGYATAASNVEVVYQLPVIMRANPNLTTSGTFRLVGYGPQTYNNISSISLHRAHPRSQYLRCTTSGLSSGLVGEFGDAGSNNATMSFSAEL